MSTLVCVPIVVQDAHEALEKAELARDRGADLVEFRVDECFSGEGDDEGAETVLRVVAGSVLPCIVTCRPTWEGGAYDGGDDARVSLFERLATSEHPPAYIDVELAAYTRSMNLRQKVNLAVAHPKQERDVPTRLILSMHDFEGRPSDLSRRLAAAYAEPAASVVKVAYRARSLRDNLELFAILRGAPKPTIALGMGEFGMMSRVLAPKFGGFLTFASLGEGEGTAPGQPTIGELLGVYRFRSIGRETKVYGVVGWPVSQSMSPLVHNAGFDAVGHDGVYVPMPVAAGEDEEANRISFDATVGVLGEDAGLGFAGASVTVPFKEFTVGYEGVEGDSTAGLVGAANTLVRADDVDGVPWRCMNSDSAAIGGILDRAFSGAGGVQVGVVGAGGVAKAAVYAAVARGADVVIYNRTRERAETLKMAVERGGEGRVRVAGMEALVESRCDVYVQCTPVGMKDGSDPEGMSIPVAEMAHIDVDTVFFDTVYNPIETAMLKAARERGCSVIDGVEIFVEQAALQFHLWTGKAAPRGLFDRLVRETLGG